ncbi:MAG: DUF4350 domain-containing protein, partial [Verrucomicrobiota bacterium]
MPNSPIHKLWALPLLLALFIGSMIWLFKQRFEVGDVYPPYSTYRADPVGARMLYESFRKLPDRTCKRNTAPLHKLPKDGGHTLFYIGDKAIGWFPTEAEQTSRMLDDFIRPGSRMVITSQPELNVNSRRLKQAPTRPRARTGKGTGLDPAGLDPTDIEDDESSEEAEDTSTGEEEEEKEEEEEEEARPEVRYGFNTAILHRWGIDLNFVSFVDGETTNHITVTRNPDLAEQGIEVEEQISWHSGLVLTNLSDAWTVIYSRDQHPVMAERKWGDGSLVIATDSYVLSNESLYKERYPQMLAWMAGDKPHILFDEVHLGTETKGGLMVLAR